MAKTAIGNLFAKNPVVGAVVVLGIGITGFLVLKKIFAPKGAKRPKIIAGSAIGLPMGWSPLPLVFSLKNEMTGIHWDIFGSRKSWTTLTELPTNDMVIAVYDAFNKQYFNLGAGTLTEWIRDEVDGIDKQLALQRLTSLQLA